MFLMDDVRKWKAVYRLLNQVETEVFDCGTLCGSACCACAGNREEMGIYLFPGEHLLLQEAAAEEAVDSAATEAADKAAALEIKGWLEWTCEDPRELGFPDSWTEPVYFLTCKTAPSCPRKLRPLQCRTFPLKPVIGENGVLEMIWNDEELPYSCPIIEKNMPIHDDFYKATYTVWTHLMRDRRIMDLVLGWS